MKKSFLNALIFTLFFFITENGVSQNLKHKFLELETTDELFKLKNTINKDNAIAFLNQFYILSLVEGIRTFEKEEKFDINNKTFKKKELILALQDHIKNENFLNGQLDLSKVEKIIKNCKSKSEFLEEISENINFNGSHSFLKAGEDEGIKYFFITKLTDETYALNGGSCYNFGAYCDQSIFLLNQKEFTNDSSFIESSNFIYGIMFHAKRKIEDTLKTEFKRKYLTAQSFGSTIINNEKYLILPYYEEKTDIDGKVVTHLPDYLRFNYSLIIAYNFQNNKFYYLYDNPTTNNDDWDFKTPNTKDEAYIKVPVKNPNWILLN